MSIDHSGKKCSMCGSYIFEDDDVVYCPECGAPHHRECYNEIGHCALEAYHGTENQYDPSKHTETVQKNEEKTDKAQKRCMRCGSFYDIDKDVCPNCIEPFSMPFSKFGFSYDPLGGVPEDVDMGDGVTAGELRDFVVSNTHRFIPKFAAVKMGRKAFFNLLAFFFPCGWFLSRKMYKQGVFAGVLEVVFSLLNIPFVSALNAFMPTDVTSYYDILEIMFKNFDKIGYAALIAALCGMLLKLFLMIISAVFGDFFYRNHCINTVKDIKEGEEDRETAFRKKGGVNIFLFLIGVLAIQYLPQIMAAFLI